MLNAFNWIVGKKTDITNIVTQNTCPQPKSHYMYMYISVIRQIDLMATNFLFPKAWVELTMQIIRDNYIEVLDKSLTFGWSNEFFRNNDAWTSQTTEISCWSHGKDVLMFCNQHRK